MKSKAPATKATAPPARSPDLRPSAARVAQSSHPAAVATGSVLDHVVARGSIDEAWAAATAQGSQGLRGRGVWERQFGASLADVAVHSGARVQTLLRRLGARGAARGNDVLVHNPGDIATLAHEVAHTIQARGGGSGSGMVAASDEAETEAEEAAVRIGAGRRIRLRRAIGRNAIALRRTVDPARGALPPLSDDDNVNETLPRVSLQPTGGGQEDPEAGARPSVRDEPAAPAEAATEDGPAPARVAQQERGEEPDQARATEDLATGEGELPASPDRRHDVDALLQDQQDNWDGAAQTADEHEAEACPRHRVGHGERPFARGPPVDVPATTELPTLDDPERSETDHSEYDRAQRDVQTQVDVAPASSSVDGGTVEAEREQQRQAQGARVRRRVESTLRQQSVTRPSDPTISLDGEADITARKASATTKVTNAMTREGTSARAATEEDFGESRMAPISDPTEGHDTQLDGLTVPEVDLQARVEASTRDRIATAGNVATLPLDDAVVVRQSTMTRVHGLAEQRGQRKQEIGQGIRRSEQSFTRLCRDGEAARQRVRTATEGEATERRRLWRAAAESHVTTREGEATTLVREKSEHAQQLADDADRDAAATLDDAHAEGTRQSEQVQQRARAKGEQSQSRSWWQRTIDWVEAQIDALVQWIDDFIDAAHRAIDVLLDKASEVAHGIVEAGRTAVQDTLDLAHRGVDAIADNLPGELGALAREHRDAMHAFLDRQQDAVDAYANGLHEDIDTAIEQTREDLHQGLEDFREGVHDVADDVREGLDVARNGIMALIRQHFPAVAAFIDQGILGPINQAGDALREWAQTALQASGLHSVQSALQDMHASRFCQAQTEEEQAADCEAFKLRLESIKADFDALLASPVAQQIQGILQESRDEAASQQVDAVSGFFSFIQWVARPVYEWWQSVEPQVSAALEFMGDMAQTAWEFVATALGLDISLPPLEAIRQGLERAWEAIAAAAQPLIARLQQAYQWLIEDSPLAPIIAFFRALPEAISALGQLLGQMTDAAGAWLAEAAQTLKDTIMPVVNRVLGLVSRAINAVVDRVVGWADRLLGAFDALMAWEAAHALLQAVITVVQAFATPIRLAIQLFRDCGEQALRTLADVIANLVEYARTIMDIVVGIVQAIVGFPVLTVAFFVGNVWRFLIPECYKAPILNFILDLAIGTVQFFPEPADFMWAALYQGLLGFLQGLRSAPDDQKVGAIDLLASIMGGNAEVVAGFAVGLVEGVWESTGGTIIFLIQAVAWLIALPFKLIRWAAGLVAGAGPGRARSQGDDTPPEQAEDDEAAQTPGEDGIAVGRRVPGLERTVEGRARGPPARETIRQAEALDRSGALDQDTPGPPPEPALDDEESVEPGTDVGAIERAGADAEGNAPAEDGGVSEAGGSQGAEPADPERPPAIPEAIAGMRATFDQLMASGFTREDVMAALDGVRETMRGFIGRIARDAAGAMLAAANAPGAGFAIGRTIGSIVGHLLVEAILAFFTGGASAGLTAAKAALTGARAAGRLASVLRRVRSAIQPLLNAMSRLRSGLGRVMGQLRRWLDDVVRWMRGIGRRAGARVRRAVGRGRGARPRPPGARPRPRRRPSRRRDRRRDRDRDRETPAEKRRRLARIVRRIRPGLQRALDDGMRPSLLAARLRSLQARHRLTRLRVVGRNRFRIIARLNPTAEVMPGVDMDVDDLLSHLRRVAAEMRQRTEGTQPRMTGGRSPTGGDTVDIPPGMSETSFAEQLGQRTPMGRGRARRLNFQDQSGATTAQVQAQQMIFAQQPPRHSTTMFTEVNPDGLLRRGAGERDYARLAARLAARSPRAHRGPMTAQALRTFARTGQAPAGFTTSQLAMVRTVLFGAEGTRALASPAFGEMSLDLLDAGRAPEELLGRDPTGGLHPLSRRGAGSDSRALDDRISQRRRGDPTAAEQRQIDIEVAMMRTWLTTQNLKFDDEASQEAREREIKRTVERRLLGEVVDL